MVQFRSEAAKAALQPEQVQREAEADQDFRSDHKEEEDNNIMSRSREEEGESREAKWAKRSDNCQYHTPPLEGPIEGIVRGSPAIINTTR